MAKKQRASSSKSASKRKVARRPRPTPAPRRVVPFEPLDPHELPDPHEPAGPPEPSSFTIVGVGASAGGFEAFTHLLKGLPVDAGLAIVFVQHLAPRHDSALPELLTAHTTLPVIQVSDNLEVQPNHVYVIPPNVQMGIEGTRLQLKPRPDDRTQYTPIDTFLTSLAESARARAIGVILSGTASDGALGIRQIKAAGGITLAQEPDTAKYDGMPRAAIATGMVDEVLSPERIGAKLASVARHPYLLGVEPTGSIQDDDLQPVFDLLRPISGVDFRHYKMPTIRRRLLRRMALHRVTDLSDYVRLLQSLPGEVRGLYQDLLIHVTRFFREPESFDALSEEVFPLLLEGRKPDHPIRVWVSGCATGEEAYSLAMCLVEFVQKHHVDARIQLFATDVSESAIEHARAGVYPRSIEADVSAERLRRFFTKTDGSYRIKKQVRDLCVFARQDLTRDPPFSRLDLIMCRNVLIYMDAMLQKKLVQVFHYALSPTGFLVLGQAETVGPHASLFKITDKRFRIHRKRVSPVYPGAAFPTEYMMPWTPKRKVPAEPATVDNVIQDEVSRAILERYAPAGVVVDADMHIVQFRGQTGTFLEPAPGEASLNLLKMVREGLLYGLRTAVHAARKSRQPARREGLQVRSGSGWKEVSVEVIPLSAGGRPHFLVMFKAADPPVDRRLKGKPKPPGNSRKERASQLQLLQRELAASREYLQAIIQELEAANEELQSANEEILSSNEELQSTNEELDTAKEELQSTNEELNTLNEELHGRNEELGRINSDLVNLIASVQIAIVIVSTNLRIRRFTPMAEKVLNLIPADLDRSIAHINPNIDVPNLDQLIFECIDTMSLLEREVQDRQGKWYSLRIRPYKTIDNKIDGAVLALFDIDQVKQSELRVGLARQYGEAILESTSQPFVILDTDLRIRNANASFSRMVAIPSNEVIGRPLDQAGGGDWDVSALRASLGRLDGEAFSFDGLTARYAPAQGAARVLSLSGRPVRSIEAPSARLLLVGFADGIPEASE